jgi:hypothetical protein
MKTPTTIKDIEADPRVWEVQRQPGNEEYSVIIWLSDGHVAADGTSTLYGRTARAAASKLKTVKKGQPE